MSFRIFLFTLINILFFSLSGIGQNFSRSGYPAPKEDLRTLRTFPCGGITILDESLEADSLPQGWTVSDLDGNSPQGNLTFLLPTGGWQVSKDPKDTTNGNFVFASPSWYTTPDTSDDWLVTPEITNLPARTCLSWYAYSADQFFGEDYEIWVSTSGNSPADFFKNGVRIDSIGNEGIEFTFRTLSLENFAGRDIYLAFRHISVDKYALVLDQIRIAQVEEIDLALLAIDEIRAKPNEDVNISGAFINRGLDTIRIDTNNFLNIFYSIDNQDTNRYAFPRNFSLPPNDTLNFVHDSLWIPEENRAYRIEVWLEQVNGDTNPENDTIGFWQGIGTATSNEIPEKFSFKVYPNPVKDLLQIELDKARPSWEAVLFDATGKEVFRSGKENGRFFEIDLTNMMGGLYFLRIEGIEGGKHVQKILVE
ncbi:MAG: choice-of-anchor J domain-containing protein [Bacteroidia bacterium]|nr:choice-of-anchor J domain-containing protein [Bacteroidia bacterium]